MKKQKFIKWFAAMLLVAAALSSVPMAAHSTAAKISVSNIILSKGDKFNIDVQGSDETKGTYTSSNKNVASVNRKGIVTAKKIGTAKVVWKNGKKRMTCRVKVVKVPNISETMLTIKEGESSRVSISGYGNSSLTADWLSENPSVVSVRNGLITGISEGKAVVTVRIRGYQKQWSRRVAVSVEKKDTQTPTVSGNTVPAVYMTADISPKGLMESYLALGWHPEGKTAVKLSTGEPPASNYLDPALIKDLVQYVDGTIVECNTAYGGSRASTAMHMQVAKDHGFTEIADVDILDADGSMSIAVAGGKHLKENYVGAHFKNYDSYLVLSHFKGHSMAGFGGAIKNISIGLGSSEGKSWIHSAGSSRTNPWGGAQDDFLESMGEAGKAVSDYLGKGDRIVYVNVMNRLSVDCDCDGNPAEPDMHDVGILASADPVALDQACVDLVFAQKDGDGASLVRRMESRNGLHTLEYAEQIGLGSRD